MVLPAVLLLILLIATGTEAYDCSFSLDCARLMDSLSSVCATYKEHPGNRRPRDTLSVGTYGNTSANTTSTLLALTTAPEIIDVDPMLPPKVAVMVFKIHRVGGRYRRSERTVNPHHECCSQTGKTCTLHEVAGYCSTFQPNYRYLANGSPCA